MDLEKKHGNGTREGLVVPDGTWERPEIAGKRALCTDRRMLPISTRHVTRLSVTLRCFCNFETQARRTEMESGHRRSLHANQAFLAGKSLRKA